MKSFYHIPGYAAEGSKGDRKALGRSGRSEIGGKQLFLVFSGYTRGDFISRITMGFAPSGATKGLSGRPLETFGRRDTYSKGNAD